jgi:hypothetical protein
MSEERRIKQLVKLVANGLRRSEPQRDILARLVAAGVPDAEAPGLFRAVKSACQQGVLSVVTGGASAPEGPPADPLLAEAFREGQPSLRGAGARVWLQRLVVLALVVGAVVLLVYWALR